MSRRRDEVASFTVRRNADDHHPAIRVASIPPRPPFDVWLADRKADIQVISNSAELLAWIDDKLDDEWLVPLTEALDERSTSLFHGFIVMKGDVPDDSPPIIGETETHRGTLITTPIYFSTSKRALKE